MRIVSYIACGEIMKLQFRVSVILVVLPLYVLPFYLKLLIRKEIVADHSVRTDSDWPQLRGLAILALRGALKFFAILNVLGEDFMVFWREHDELFNCFPEEFKNSKSFPSGPFYFRFVLPDSLF